jgi:hypothetical protein
VVLTRPATAPDPIDTVIALDIVGPPAIVEPPAIEGDSPIFVDATEIRLATGVSGAEIRYTLDGSVPRPGSPRYEAPLRLTNSTTVRAALFRDGEPLSGVSEAVFEAVEPRAAVDVAALEPGLRVECFEGTWETVPDFGALGEPRASGVAETIGLAPASRDEYFGLRFRGYVTVPRRGVWRFSVDSDDGSRLWIGETLVVDNDGLHAPKEASGEIALDPGPHPITVGFFQGPGGRVLEASIEGPGVAKRAIPPDWLGHPAKGEAGR